MKGWPRDIDGSLRGISLLFLGANALKIVLFNLSLPHDRTGLLLAYKLPVTLAIMLLLGSVWLRLPRWLFLAVYLLQAAYIFAYLNYFHYARNFPGIAQALSLSGEAAAVLKSGAMTPRPESLLLLLDLPILLAWWLRPRREGEAVRILSGRTAAACWLVLGLAEALNLKQGKSILHAHHRYEHASMVRRYGTLVNGLTDLSQFPGEKKLVASLEPGPGREVPDQNLARRPNLVTIQVESMGAALFTAEPGGVPAFPRLRELAASGVYHPYMLAYHFGGGSSDAGFTALNGIEPLQDFTVFKLRNYGYPNSVVKLLKSKGYAAWAFHGNHRDFYNRNAAFRKIGFDRFYDPELSGLPEVGWGTPDHLLLQFAIRKAVEIPEPFYLHVITISMHQPFNKHRAYYPDVSPAGLPAETGHLLNASRYLDSALAAFIAELRAVRPHTAFLIWGDHVSGVRGPGFDDAGLPLDGQTMEFVPFIALVPDRPALRGHAAVGFLDLAPTILQASGGGYHYRAHGPGLLDPDFALGAPEMPYRGRRLARGRLFEAAASAFGD